MCRAVTLSFGSHFRASAARFRSFDAIALLSADASDPRRLHALTFESRTAVIIFLAARLVAPFAPAEHVAQIIGGQRAGAGRKVADGHRGKLTLGHGSTLGCEGPLDRSDGAAMHTTRLLRRDGTTRASLAPPLVAAVVPGAAVLFVLAPVAVIAAAAEDRRHVGGRERARTRRQRIEGNGRRARSRRHCRGRREKNKNGDY